MSSESEQDNRIADPHLAIAGSPDHRPAIFREPPPASRSEAQLRFEVAELDARLTEVTRCLEAAENRTAEVESVKGEVERQLGVIVNSRSWRMTGPLRTAGRRIRSLVRG